MCKKQPLGRRRENFSCRLFLFFLEKSVDMVLDMLYNYFLSAGVRPLANDNIAGWSSR